MHERVKMILKLPVELTATSNILLIFVLYCFYLSVKWLSRSLETLSKLKINLLDLHMKDFQTVHDIGSLYFIGTVSLRIH